MANWNMTKKGTITNLFRNFAYDPFSSFKLSRIRVI